jgi:hypothetical protein
MKKYFFALSFFLLLVSCKKDKEAAWSQLEAARNLYENTQYGSAKQALDDLKKQYPKEWEVQKDALQLMREIELAEQKRDWAYSDSLLNVRRAEADSLKPYFVFIKDPQYDNIGRYVDKEHNPPVDAGFNHIKISVDESGEIVLTSVYRGASAIKHNRLKITAPTGEYAETQIIPFDGGANYSFQNGIGTIYEIVTYQKGRDDGVVRFIYDYANEKLTMEYRGGKKIPPVPVSAKEKKAIVRTVDFAAIFKDIDRLQKEREKAEKRIEYLQSKLQ